MSRLISDDLTPYEARLSRNIPEDAVPLKEGAKVTAADDARVGSVEQVFSESDTNRVTHILVSTGGISARRKMIPVTWIRDFDEESVQLAVSRAQIDSLSDHTEK
jgi:uncharacterized protein YrrD